jgi:uncharacterized membrane protein YeaQ/YmgE (transglycosylase-associated protein family)
MEFVNCLWIGVLAGLIASRLRLGGNYITAASCIAVGVLGALMGSVARGWIGPAALDLLSGELPFAVAGAATALAAWFLARWAIASSASPHAAAEPRRRSD